MVCADGILPKASVALSKMTGISFNTLPAIPVEEFDKLMADI
jgi:hypothetical protein